MFGFRKPKRAPDGAENDPGVDDDAFVIVERTLHPYLISIHEPDSFRAEQIRGLRNKLMVMNPDGSPRTLVITSAVKGEGKSVTTLNLAVAFAELESTRILVIDADLRQGNLEGFLGLDRRPGLTELLLGRIDLHEAIRPTGIDGVSLIGSGTRGVQPSEILGTRRVDDLFAQLKLEYQYILIDTPPAVPITDASVLSAKADGTLIVVRLEHSPRSLVQQTVKVIQDLGGNLLGTYVTGVRGADPSADDRYAYPQAE
jgi:capsular exopolysaccharide synthesis family protein